MKCIYIFFYYLKCENCRIKRKQIKILTIHGPNFSSQIILSSCNYVNNKLTQKSDMHFNS